MNHPANYAASQVMIVDDTPANLLLLETILKELGCKISAFPRGDLALQAAFRNPPDLVLLDIMMPELNGFDVARSLRIHEGTREVPVLFISALNSLEDKVQAFSQGGVDYISKPFQEKEVLARVRTHLDLSVMRKMLRDRNRLLEQLVAERTSELTRANEQLSRMSRIKEDFLMMISHELRTPANGILLLGEIFLENENDPALVELYRTASERLLALIDHATQLMELEKLSGAPGKGWNLLPELQNLVEAHGGSLFVEEGREDSANSAQPSPPAELSLGLPMPQSLFIKAMQTFLDLGRAFSSSPLNLRLSRREHLLYLRLPLDHFDLSAPEAASFFDLASQTRISSIAESLGLAPVVAASIFHACGGGLQLLRSGPGHGILGAWIPCEVRPLPAEQAAERPAMAKPGSTA